ncbi:MAG: molybdopterin-guanine dinucleotide biosynthesis protein B [Synergistaceae bacterium]|nr:molybdopterin-guanine dinucleotide biosynthesis protein B [Synergistaceae bacterium]
MCGELISRIFRGHSADGGKSKAPIVVAGCGVKNSGKTTLLSRVLPLLRERGLKAAVIKHDGHEFEPDVRGTDSYRLRTAGALGVAVYSRNTFMVVRQETQPSVEGLIPYFRDMDLVLLEGGKNSPYPKVEVVRAAVSSRPVSDPRTLLGLCSDADLRIEGVPRLSLTDYEGVANLIEQFCASALTGI